MHWWADFAKEAVKENLKIGTLDLKCFICSHSILMLIKIVSRDTFMPYAWFAHSSDD